MSVPKNILAENKGLDKWAMVLAYRGSIAHNMHVPNTDPNSIDDIDLMGVCVPSEKYYLGLSMYGSDGTQEIKREQNGELYDIVVYELKKFMKLLMNGNPNVLSILWLRDNYYLKTSEAFRALKDHRELFVGKHVYKSFVGYAHGQLHRMTHQAYQGYMGDKRKKLVEQFGYDTKNAAHLIRLLRMGIEFLGDGELEVFRQDSAELLEIKRGKWSLEKVLTESDRLFKLAEEAYVRSPLPPKPDKDKIEELTIKLIKTAWKGRDERV